ncbi:MAG: hypothetical protein EOP82_30350 [Variovorax sp.]|nr:MAG: hypothetical protein EOP82_30350 [Variovorax sp.]
MDSVVARLRASGLPMEDDWLRRIEPAHFSHTNFRGTFRFNLEKYGHLLGAALGSGHALSHRRSPEQWRRSHSRQA